MPYDLRLLLVGLAATGFAAGCDVSVTGSRGVWSTSWSVSESGVSEVAGLSTAEVSVGVVDGQDIVIFWTDATGGDFSSATGPEGGVLFSGTRRSPDGREFAIRCVTADGRTGSVTIDGSSFRLEEGHLFLIRSAAGATVVRQLDLPIPERDPHADNDFARRLREFGRGTPAIRDFFSPPPAEADADPDSEG